MEAIRKAERSPVAFNSQFICSHLYSLPFGFSYLFFPFPTTFICSNFPNTSYFYLLFLLFAATLDYSIFNLPQFQFSPFSLILPYSLFITTSIATLAHEEVEQQSVDVNSTTYHIINTLQNIIYISINFAKPYHHIILFSSPLPFYLMRKWSSKQSVGVTIL